MQPSREQSSIRQKLGSILGLSASRAPALPQKSYDELGRPEHSTFFTADVLRVGSMVCSLPSDLLSGLQPSDINVMV